MAKSASRRKLAAKRAAKHVAKLQAMKSGDESHKGKSKCQQRRRARLNGAPMAARKTMPWWFPNLCPTVRSAGEVFAERADSVEEMAAKTGKAA